MRFLAILNPIYYLAFSATVSTLVLASNYIDVKRQLMAALASVIILFACSSAELDEDDGISQSLVPVFVSQDLWLENGLELISKIKADENLRTFQAETADLVQVEIGLDGNDEIAWVSIPVSPQAVKTIYFEYGRPAFSETKMEGNANLISAYADNRDYAYAYENGAMPKNDEIGNARLSHHTVHSAISLAEHYRQKEKNTDYNTRIQANAAILSGTVESLEEAYVAVVNVKKGEKLNIDLESNEQHIYFTLSPKTGSDMEHKNWLGRSDFSGDLTIRVFSAEETKNGSFRLKFEKS